MLISHVKIEPLKLHNSQLTNSVFTREFNRMRFASIANKTGHASRVIVIGLNQNLCLQNYF